MSSMTTTPFRMTFLGMILTPLVLSASPAMQRVTSTPYTLWGDDAVATWWSVIVSGLLATATLVLLYFQYRLQERSERDREKASQTSVFSPHLQRLNDFETQWRKAVGVFEDRYKQFNDPNAYRVPGKIATDIEAGIIQHGSSLFSEINLVCSLLELKSITDNDFISHFDGRLIDWCHSYYTDMRPFSPQSSYPHMERRANAMGLKPPVETPK